MDTDLRVDELLKRFGTFTAVDNVSFEVPQGRFFSILGPSGCGKTTLLRMIAGFETPTGGTIAIRGRDMAGIPPNRRPVNLVFQHLALFPMMDVAENVAFGLRRRRERTPDIRRKVAEALERVDLGGFGDKRIDQLSGGQKQRVAIARCLVLEPSVLLLDEPLGALDLKLREQMKVELRALQTKVGTTFVYITHDQSEALVMSDAVAVMNSGRFEQVDTPRNLYDNPATPFVAGFVGDTNILRGRVREADADTALVETQSGLACRCRAGAGVGSGEGALLFVRPEAFIIEPDDTPDLTAITVRVDSVLFDGANSRLLARADDATGTELTIALPQNRRFDHLVPGSRVRVGWHTQAALCFGAKDGD
ncbi:spermidine/putrescine transport system ATP-binding protein [Desulfobaculum xiamenense]|uniref:Spermidine/putrescine transport system ATP-binding protein n=1 Tax=Desulfobaculum xiamenense TaxID=995050 RepID=A0A846QRB3_9BACT|nr:ABC transporter ATP-binding protein [Desulfobaculum xiamenense]NJB67925.1 spermidine/putrescine transport system ATP-binding protein [Desulfobaculum xiamenense]